MSQVSFKVFSVSVEVRATQLSKVPQRFNFVGVNPSRRISKMETVVH